MTTSFVPTITVTASQNTYFKALPYDSTTLPPNQLIPLKPSDSFEFKTLHRKGSHYFLRLNKPFPNTPSGFPEGGTCGYVYAEHVKVDNWPIIGVWLTHIDSDGILSSEELLKGTQDKKGVLDELANLGFNTLYPTVWTDGYTLYPSKVTVSSGLSLRHPGVTFNFPSYENDMLRAIVELGHEKGFRVIPWFESGLQVGWYGESRCKWLTDEMADTWLAFNTKDKTDKIKIENGKQVIQNGAVPGWAWLNPFNKDVFDFMVNLITDVVTRYNVDGIQLDDHFGLNPEQIYNGKGELLFHSKETAAEKITSLLRKIRETVKESISLSPGGLWPSGSCDWSRDHCLSDWQKWENENEKLIDEVVPQLYGYHSSTLLDSFSKRLGEGPISASCKKVLTIIGLDIGSKVKTDRVSLQIIKEQFQRVKQCVQSEGYAGISLFFYGSLWIYIPSEENPKDRKAGLQTIFKEFKKI